MGLVAALEVMYRHPIVCGLLLLLLTPSLFNIVVYFSPLLISTSLFFVALISMGPRLEETREERERWAKGERYFDDEAARERPTSTASESSTFVQRWGFLLPGDPAAWFKGFDDAKLKLMLWIDNALKAPASTSSPLTPRDGDDDDDDSVATVLPSAHSFFAPKALDEDIPPIEEKIPAAAQHIPSAPSKEQDERRRPKSIDLDMPELEIIDEIEEPSAASTIDTGGPVVESSAPIFDEPPAPTSSSKDREVPLDEPVSEALLPAEGQRNMPPQRENVPPPSQALEMTASQQQKIPATLEKIPSQQQKIPVTLEKIPSQQQKIPATLEKIPSQQQKVSATSETQRKLPASVQTTEKIPSPPQKILSPEKRVHFNTIPAVDSSPSPVKPLSSGSPRDVHGRILKDLRTRMDELQKKQKQKHAEVHSRRMAIKHGRQMSSSGSSSD